MQVFRAPHFPLANALEEEFFGVKLLPKSPFCAQTIESVTCQQIKVNAPTPDFVDKNICEERWPPLN